MGHHVRVLENVETDEEPRILLENPETDDERSLLSSDDSGSDIDLDLQNVQLDEWDRAFLDRVCGAEPRQKAKPAAGDSHTAAQPSLTPDGEFESLRSEQETLASQALVSGSRVTARRVLPSREPEKEVDPAKSPLFKACFKLLFEMTEGAYREKSPDLMEFLAEELSQVQKRYKVLVKAGSDAGFGSPSFQSALATWRTTLDMAEDPAVQMCEGSVTFEKTLERVRNPRPKDPEPTTSFELTLGAAEKGSAQVKYKKVAKRKYSDPPLVDVHRRACERLTMELLDGAIRTPEPLLLLELLLEDFQHVQRRQQVLLRAEMAAAMEPPTTQQVEGPVTCNTGSSKGDGLSVGKGSMNPTCQLIPNPISGAPFPFTSSQWAEFEHHILIFKYMMAGVNIPNEILDPIHKSGATMNGIASHHAANRQPLALPFPAVGSSGTFHSGVANNNNNTDSEPGRCRRTDGKKWRCARNIVPNQKYCERHMHRGRHRSSTAASAGQFQRQPS